MSKGLQIALGALAIAALLGWYASSAIEGGASFRYFQTLQEFRAAGSPEQRVRVHGYVVPGSIRRDLHSKTVRFAVQNDPPHQAGAEAGGLPVSYASLEVPDLFKDGAEVVVEGRLEGRGDTAVFQATNVLAKCPSKFQAKATQAAAF
jgi:cytochrome c-type biogenesis protein CcmE